MSRNNHDHDEELEDEDEDDDAEPDEPEAAKAKSYKPGCATVMMLVGAALVAGGVYLMNRWDRLPGAGKGGAVVLVVFGTLLALPFLLLLALKVIVKVLLGRVTKELTKAGQELSEAGEEMLLGNKALYENLHQFRAADEDDFDELDRSAYEEAARVFAGLGFRHLGDVVDETIEEASDVTTVIRVLASTDGTTLAGFYHFNPPVMPHGTGGQPLLMCDLATEFTDGTFLATANTKGLDGTTAATGIDRRQHALETPIPDLVRSHEAEKLKLLAAKEASGAGGGATADAAPVTAVVIRTLADALESEQRQQALKNAFRKQIGYIDPEEVRRIAKSADHDDDLADLSARAAEKARRKRRDM